MPIARAASPFFDVEAGTRPDGSMFFAPDDLVVHSGDRVTIRVRNLDAEPPRFHNLGINDWYGPGRDIDWQVEGGQQFNRTFDADRTGRFELLCRVEGHAQAGMRGSFEIVAAPAPQLPASLVATALLLGAALWKRGMAP